MYELTKCQECNGTGERLISTKDLCNICNGSKIDPRITNTKIGTIGISNFVRRQTKESRFSYYGFSDRYLLNLVNDNLHTKKSKYRPDVLGITVPPEGFYSGIVVMKNGDRLTGIYAPRKEGEEPRTQIGVVGGQKMPAKFVEIILYSREALAEGNENSLDVDWEIISINASPTEDKYIPLRPMTLIANHFQLSGGTATDMDEKEFVAELKKSVEFWKDKGMVTNV